MKNVILSLIIPLLLLGCKDPLSVGRDKTNIDTKFFDTPPNVSSANLVVAEDTNITVPLTYTSVKLDPVTQCEVKDLNNLIQNQPCVCTEGVCSIDVQGSLNFFGTASFAYRVKATSWSAWAPVSVNVTPVNDAPTISSIVSQTVKADRFLNIPFSVGDVDSPIDCASVTVTSSDPTIILPTDIVISGSGGICSAKVSPTLNVDGTANVNLSVTDGEFTAVSTFPVTVVAISSIVLSSNFSKISVDYKNQYNLIATYSDGSKANANDTATWSSTGPTILNSQGNGLFKGRAPGAVTVTATLKSLTQTLPMSILAWTNLSLSLPYIKSGIYSIIQQRGIVTLSDASVFEVTDQTVWSCVDTTIANIHPNGKTDLKSVGLTSLSGTFGSSTIGGLVKVLPTSLLSITISGNASLSVFGTNSYTALASYSDGTTTDITNSADWSVDNSAVATISNQDGKKGKTTAISSGTIIITANMGSISGTMSVNVNNSSVSSIVISPANQLGVRGQKIHYTAQATFSNGSTADVTASVLWVSSAPSVATISSSNALITTSSNSTNSTVISASLSGVTGSTNLNVFNADFSSLYFDSSGTVAVGDNIPLKIYGLTNDGGSVDITSVVNLSSNLNNILSISNADSTKGIAYGLSPGTANITATFGSLTATQAFVVDPTTSSLLKKGDGLRASYYSDANLTNFVSSRLDAQINYNWSTNSGPLGLSDYFSIRWTGFLRARATEATYICTLSDDGIRVYIDGVLVINHWVGHSAAYDCSPALPFVQDSMHSIVVEYDELTGYAQIQLGWYSAQGSEVIPQSNLYSH